MKQLRISLIGILVLLSGCASPSKSCCNTGSSQVQHIVVCWLKAPGNVTDRQRLIDTSRSFQGKIPGLLSVTAGTVLPSKRIGVESTFDVAVVMTFVDESALAEYEAHPVHQQAVKEVLKPLVERFVIYDFVDTPKK
jgi:hypothetical protein